MDVLRDLTWKGETVLVVGGGPSQIVRPDGIDRVISCNGAASANSDLIVSRDPPWARAHLDRLSHTRPAIWVEVGGFKPRNGVQVIPRLGAHGWSSTLRGVYCGGHTGYCAAQIADALVGHSGTIHLAGFDYSKPGAEWPIYAREWQYAAPKARLEAHAVTPYLRRSRGSRRIAVHGYLGLGDNIYQRPFIRQLLDHYEEVALLTAWPQIYHDMPGLRFVDPKRVGLRTQAKNLDRFDVQWDLGPKPPDCTWIRVGYGPTHFQRGLTILEAYEQAFHLQLGESVDFDFGCPWTWREAARRRHDFPRGPYGVFRPDTERKEWRAGGRSPQRGVMPAVVEAFPELEWVSVADLADGEEWMTDREPRNVSRRFHRGELRIEDMIALFADASMVVGGCGFAVPLCLALDVPMFVVFGGAFPPNQVVDRRIYRRMWWASPEPFCACYQSTHDCKKPLDVANTVDSARMFLEAIS